MNVGELQSRARNFQVNPWRHAIVVDVGTLVTRMCSHIFRCIHFGLAKALAIQRVEIVGKSQLGLSRAKTSQLASEVVGFSESYIREAQHVFPSIVPSKREACPQCGVIELTVCMSL